MIFLFQETKMHKEFDITTSKLRFVVLKKLKNTLIKVSLVWFYTLNATTFVQNRRFLHFAYTEN